MGFLMFLVRYERYWDITDEEYLAQLETKREEITHEILERCRTKRKNLYITGPVALNVAQKFSVHRLCDKEGKHNLANRFVGELMEQLVQDGLLVTTKTGTVLVSARQPMQKLAPHCQGSSK